MPPDVWKACGLPVGEGLTKGYALVHRRGVAPNEKIEMRTEGQRLSETFRASGGEAATRACVVDIEYRTAINKSTEPTRYLGQY